MVNPVPVPVTDFPAAGSLDGTEIVPVVKAGITSQSTTQDIADLAGQGGAPLGPTAGGTGISSYNEGDMIYAIADDVLGTLARATGSRRYMSNTPPSGVPGWDVLVTGDDDLDVGYLDVPQHIAEGDITFALSDRGKHVYADGGVVITEWVIPLNSTVAFPVGSAITLVNNAADPISIVTEVPVTLIFAGTGAVAGATLAQYGMATILKLADDTWIINGAGLTAVP